MEGKSEIPELMSEESGQSAIKKKQRMNGQKTCRVCGDRALAHNFDVISCESCKAFFRRNALKTKTRPCAFSGDCEITPETRRFCAHCRLEKCLASGMRADMILDVDEKKTRQEKLAENRRKREESQTQQQQHQLQQPQQLQQQHQLQQPQQLQQQHQLQQPQELQQQHQLQQPQQLQQQHQLQQPQQLQQQQQLQQPQQKQQLPQQQQHQKQQVQQQHQLQQQQQQQPQPHDHHHQQPQDPFSFQDAQTSLDQIVWTGSASASSGSGSLSWSGSGSEPCLSPDAGSEWVIPPPSAVAPVNRSLRGSQARSEFLERARHQATLLDFSLLLPQQPSPPAAQQEVDASFQHVPRDALPSDPLKYWRLGEEERALLTELTLAYQQTVLRRSECPEDPNSTLDMGTVLGRCQRFAADIVNFVKRVPDFRQLCMQDQVAVLKGASWRTFLVKSSANFVVERNSWVKDHGYMSVDQFTQASPEHRDKILLMARYSAALKNILRNDPTTFAVLQVLVLFDPRDPNLRDRQLVSEKGDKYAVLLKRLLQSQWSYDYAGHYLNAVRGKVQEMAWVADSVHAMFRDWVHLMGPLMREVLNLS